MTKPHRLNDAPVLDLIEGQYEKFLLMILCKYLPEGASITEQDIVAMVKDQESTDPFVLFTHGHKHSLDFKAIRTSAAARIADHENATNRGRA